MEAIAALLLFLLSLCILFFPLSKLLPWLHSFLFSTHPKPPNSSSTTHTTEKREECDLETVFATFDSDGDGFISKVELVESLKRLGLTATGDEVRSMMEKADTNNDGLIDFNEFKELSLSWGLTSRGGGDGEEDGELREAFAVFDGNGDGMITMEELSLVLKSLGLKEGERVEACREMIKKVDTNGDGMINFEEFKKMMIMKEGKIF
ncbi:calmodulin-like protein 7 [Dendrobium catenatum]|uniref:Calmodulin-like protein 4 n=1 Tax=Dendrobium catenatum TaxID=906689 RepID=A0A2I0W270_9ASPA|nr:calmodulin-like protein 7 [Dendrobium catenatum]PKU69759.1 Calmodulin-like protein 4 [Dendrobium catenatum]